MDREASWDPPKDVFFLTVCPITGAYTKRYILSVFARLFDVLGLVAPVILYAKLLIKELWISKVGWDEVGWDEVVPDHIAGRFSALSEDFPILNQLRIARHIGVRSDGVVRLVAFFVV